MRNKITINESAVPAAVASAGRQIMLVVGGYLIGRGYIQADTWAAIGTIGTIAAPFAYGQYVMWVRHRENVEVYDAAPSSVSEVIRK